MQLTPSRENSSLRLAGDAEHVALLAGHLWLLFKSPFYCTHATRKTHTNEHNKPRTHTNKYIKPETPLKNAVDPEPRQIVFEIGRLVSEPSLARWCPEDTASFPITLLLHKHIPTNTTNRVPRPRWRVPYRMQLTPSRDKSSLRLAGLSAGHLWRVGARKMLQKRRVSSAAADTTVVPSGLFAMRSTRAWWRGGRGRPGP